LLRMTTCSSRSDIEDIRKIISFLGQLESYINPQFILAPTLYNFAGILSCAILLGQVYDNGEGECCSEKSVSVVK